MQWWKFPKPRGFDYKVSFSLGRRWIVFMSARTRALHPLDYSSGLG